MNPLYKRLPDGRLNPVQGALAALNISVTEFARRAGITRPFASRIVNGTTTPSRAMAEDIADMLGLDPAEVMWPFGRERLVRSLRSEILASQRHAGEKKDATEENS